jgi:hypothetical protein
MTNADVIVARSDGSTLYMLNDSTSDYKGVNFLQGFGMPKLDSLLKFDR